ncbi:MAG: radical SAM protein [Nitrospiraceae bacterium]|nr:radical SAM protein [Nitrospiraceae bacterium]
MSAGSMKVELRDGVIYGPVRSRRLGRSLGINLLPASAKFCNYDCVYCFFGPTSVSPKQRRDSSCPKMGDIRAAVDSVVQRVQRQELKVDFFTFSGNGEPTLHPEFAGVTHYVLEKLSSLSPAPQTAIFTNGTLLGRTAIRRAISRIDQAIVKIDIVDEVSFRTVNRPLVETRLRDIAKAVAQLPNVRIQTAVMKRGGVLYEKAAWDYYCSLIKVASPQEVQLYNVVYPPAEEGVEAATIDEIKMLAKRLRGRLRVSVKVFHLTES